MRAVAALLHAGPGAVLSGRSAGHVWGLVRAEPDPIEVSVPWNRIVRPPPGVIITRGRHVLARTHPTEWPHRISAPHTVWDLAAKRDLDGAITLAAKALSLGIAATGDLRLGPRCSDPGSGHHGLFTEILTEVLARRGPVPQSVATCADARSGTAPGPAWRNGCRRRRTAQWSATGRREYDELRLGWRSPAS